MGKRLIIKDADFSANALYIGVEWTTQTCGKPYITSNPDNARFGQTTTADTTSDSYHARARLAGTIAVPAGKKIIIEFTELATGIRKDFIPDAFFYPSAWSGVGTGFVVPVEIPSDNRQFYSILFNANNDVYSRYEWVNNKGVTAYFMMNFMIDGESTITGGNYPARYAVVDP